MGLVSDPFTLWNAHKSYMRSIFIKLGAGIKRRRQQRIDSILSDIKITETQNKANPNPSLSYKLLSLRSDLRSSLLEFHERAIRCMKWSYYFSGNKAGKLLANKLRGQIQNTSHITPHQEKRCATLRRLPMHSAPTIAHYTI